MATGIKQVAEQAGVSIATVSRVLSDQPHVSPRARTKVMTAVEALGYQPSRVAQRLRLQRSGIIGLIISDIQNSFFTSIVRAIEDVAQQHGCAILLCNTDEKVDKERFYIDLLAAEGVAGVIMSPTNESDASCRRLIDLGIPVVTIDRRVANLDVDRVLIDNRAGAQSLTEHLIDHGHSEIAALVGVADITTGRERLEGYVRALEGHGLLVRPEYIRSGLMKEDVGYQMAHELLSLPRPPSALFCGNNLLAMGALRAIYERNLVVPDEVALVSFDEVPWMPLVKPALTVLVQPMYEMGNAAANLLLERIANRDGVREVILEAWLKVGDSCGRHDRADGARGYQGGAG
jgi:DNA-binding LacI/PurR family transcriptional regulator